ncbi:predicted protein [Verticillium alfalfae VaMs.102]|uniref:Predicted protein n=1 Tax=Verticillium alfalfae (strain VaMs.102 / ATCC MYA-4576 / FGSC 10136) TaxID=526221 RepID=C9SGF1_VERA1|nr:predicted protein [Verticillium alfalfae VaMs.102]EEY17491.1 predicted protein [Verticillium alfalfae VaMs.102]
MAPVTGPGRLRPVVSFAVQVGIQRAASLDHPSLHKIAERPIQCKQPSRHGHLRRTNPPEEDGNYILPFCLMQRYFPRQHLPSAFCRSSATPLPLTPSPNGRAGTLNVAGTLNPHRPSEFSDLLSHFPTCRHPGIQETHLLISIVNLPSLSIESFVCNPDPRAIHCKAPELTRVSSHSIPGSSLSQW